MISKIVSVLIFSMITCSAMGQSIKIVNDRGQKKIHFSNATLSVELNYNRQATISSLEIKGQQTLSNSEGIFSEIRTKEASYSTRQLRRDPVIGISNNIVRITNIAYGDDKVDVKEDWTFTVYKDSISMEMARRLSKDIEAEEIASPVIRFKNIGTWDGAFQDYGGLAWFYLFNKRSDTYGVHSRSASFWNSKIGNGLTITVDAPGQEVAMSYSRTETDELAYKISTSQAVMIPRFDAGTNRRRFLRDTVTTVWSPVKIRTGFSKQRLSFSYFDFNEKYGRGKLVGINGEQVSNVLNTIARIGVIDKNHFGGNSWHTPYGPICLHEQYIAQMGLAINDKNYLKGYRDCLDFYRDNAIKPDGRVWPRWAYSNEDAMPGVFTDKGFYEAQWGYLLDSNPDLVINVAELFDQTGDLAWVKTHRRSCEKALDWILQRDRNNNGLVEMMTDSMEQRRGSDWIDIIWASYENAFVNAKLYHALVMWAAVEKQLGNELDELRYRQFAVKLKGSFNKSVEEGGFWDGENGCYIHWRDKNGSIHGRNMVTPVNFMAIGYGICDDVERSKQILDKIEAQMQQEKLFFWPLCLFSYGKGEGNDWQFPFPNYENGDIFLSWGALGVKAYAAYKPDLALKYVKNVLAQYDKDGLAFQRYGRAKQDGLGDDILSGNSLSVVGLYQGIYGVNPLHNRFYLNPHITEELSGTQLNYQFRDQKLVVDLAMQDYAVSNGQYQIRAKKDFGFFALPGKLYYFDGNTETADLVAITKKNADLSIKISNWEQGRRSWTQFSKAVKLSSVQYQVHKLKPNTIYQVRVNDNGRIALKSTPKGSINIECPAVRTESNIEIMEQ